MHLVRIMPHFFTSLLLWLLLAISSRVLAQTLPLPDSTRAKTYTYIEKMPVFPVLAPGDSSVPSNQRFMRFLNADVHFPARALHDGVSGKVHFSFEVNGQGRAQNIKMVKGLRDDVDAEVLRNAHRIDAIQWQPGTQNGRPVTVSFTVPMSFNIDTKQPQEIPGTRWTWADTTASWLSRSQAGPANGGRCPKARA